MVMRRSLVIVGLAVLAVFGGAAWYWLKPRVITVCAYADPEFQRRANWKDVLAARFREVSRIYSSQTGVQWKLVVEIQGSVQDGRFASVNPFSHAAVIADSPDDTELHNTLRLAHELAHEFGALHDDPANSTLMTPNPGGETFSPRTAALIRRVRGYPFAQGVEGLRGSWDSRVANALTVSMGGLYAKPAAHADYALAVALSEDKDDDDAIVHLRTALKEDS